MDTNTWITVVAVTFTAFSVIAATVQYIRSEIWKKVEFVGEQYKIFAADPLIESALLFLDYNNKTTSVVLYEGENKLITFSPTTEVLIRAMRNADDTDKDDGLSRAIREAMNQLFAGLERFYDFINNGVIKEKHLDSYLAYWIDVMMNPDRHRGKEFVDAVRTYALREDFFYAYCFLRGYSGRAAHWVKEWQRKAAERGIEA